VALRSDAALADVVMVNEDVRREAEGSGRDS